MLKGRTQRYYDTHPEARRKKNEYQKRYNKRPGEAQKRAELARKRRHAKKNGQNIEGKDYDHAVKKFVPLKVNRGRNEKSRRKGYKRSRTKLT